MTEACRLQRLRQLAILDAAPEAGFDRLTRLAKLCLDVPTAIVSLVDADRQFFKSQVGLPEPFATRRQTPLSHSLCQHVVRRAAPLVVRDARAEPVLRDNVAIHDVGVIAYAGVPLVTADGVVLGPSSPSTTSPGTGRRRSWRS